MPLVAKTPISLLAREIIQYASTIDEAINIVKTRNVFVAESIMIGSATDNKAVVIEVSPNKFGVYDIKNTNQLICSNHFQSDAYKEDENNTKHILESHSKYRFDKMSESFDQIKYISPKSAVTILRDKSGLNNQSIGYGNEKALNQLLAHHGVVFKPSERQIWVSSNPYQLGAFVAYDLDDIFNNSFSKINSFENEQLTIPSDPFITTQEFIDYEDYREVDRSIDDLLEHKSNNIDHNKLTAYIALNPDLWIPYFKTGKYYYQKKWYAKALPYFEMALRKEVTTTLDIDVIKWYLNKCYNKLN